MVGIRSFPFGMAYFQGRTASFGEAMILHSEIELTYPLPGVLLNLFLKVFISELNKICTLYGLVPRRGSWYHGGSPGIQPGPLDPKTFHNNLNMAMAMMKTTTKQYWSSKRTQTSKIDPSFSSFFKNKPNLFMLCIYIYTYYVNIYITLRPFSFPIPNSSGVPGPRLEVWKELCDALAKANLGFF